MCHKGFHAECSSKQRQYRLISLIREEERRQSNHWNQLFTMKNSTLAGCSGTWLHNIVTECETGFWHVNHILVTRNLSHELQVMSYWICSDYEFIMLFPLLLKALISPTWGLKNGNAWRIKNDRCFTTANIYISVLLKQYFMDIVFYSWQTVISFIRNNFVIMQPLKLMFKVNMRILPISAIHPIWWKKSILLQ